MIKEVIVLGAGCFWGVEEAFSRQVGVISTRVGYSGGYTSNPSYKDICETDTGHAEVVEVIFDNEKTNLVNILNYFFQIHDPTSLNKQGNDVGTQYRSAIFHMGVNQETEIRTFISKVKDKYKKPVVTEVSRLENFWEAEEYHQKYLKKNPNGYCHIKF